MRMYAVRDSAVEAFHMPMFFPTDAAAIRALGDAVNKPQEDNVYYKHPEHFNLYSIGEFNEENGLINSHPPEFVVSCEALIRT